jgi:hypothetical protein
MWGFSVIYTQIIHSNKDQEMKTLKLTILAVAMLFAGTITVKAQTADEVIDKYAAAIGGKENWKKVNSVKMEGTMSAQGAEIAIALTAIQNKAQRMDISFGGMSGYTILTNTGGWSFMPFAGQTKPEAMTAEVVKEGQSGLDVRGEQLFDYKAHGCKVEFLGKDDIEGTQCFKIKHVNKAGIEKTLYFDASNYYLIREVQKGTADGKEYESVKNLSNYTKQPEGVVVPMGMEADGGDISFKKIEINKPIDESLFKAPAIN